MQKQKIFMSFLVCLTMVSLQAYPQCVRNAGHAFNIIGSSAAAVPGFCFSFCWAGVFAHGLIVEDVPQTCAGIVGVCVGAGATATFIANAYRSHQTLSQRGYPSVGLSATAIGVLSGATGMGVSLLRSYPSLAESN